MRSPGSLCDVYLAGAADLRELDLDAPADAELVGAQQRRYDRLRIPNARREFLAVRRIARAVIAAELGLAPQDVTLEQRCPECSSEEHGRPLPVHGIWVSWSHTSAAVAVAVSRSEIGVDVEAATAFAAAPEQMEAMVCTPQESASLPRSRAARNLALARLWCAKEALIKVGETGLDGMRRIQVGLVTPAVRTWAGKQQSWFLTPLELDGAVGAVAGIMPARVRQVDVAQLTV